MFHSKCVLHQNIVNLIFHISSCEHLVYFARSIHKPNKEGSKSSFGWEAVYLGKVKFTFSCYARNRKTKINNQQQQQQQQYQ